MNLFAHVPRQRIDRTIARPIGNGGDMPPSPDPGLRRPSPSRQSLRGLNWFIFFLADVQTGFGPFIAVYLTTQKWTQVEIGFVLSIAGLVGLIGQMPGGAIVDAARSERLVAGLAVATIGVSALGYAAWPIFPVVVVAATLHAAASCSVPRLRRSASDWSGRLRSASGSAATPATPRLAMASPRP
jgi:predicted MFS family arabinose efflux permease